MKRRLLAASEKIAWLRLARTPRIGPLTFHRLTARFGGPGAALEALPRLARAGEAAMRPPSVASAEDEIAGLERIGARLIASCEPDYPPLLAEVDPPPPIIALRGRALFDRPAVALVGARECSAVGLRLAREVAGELGALGYVTVSGMARGIDTAVHEASLETGAIAVLAGGIDKPYPPQNAALYEKIAEQGALVSEAPLGSQARARDFPRRNHIISGLALGVVVIEAALRSGSLITARAALEQNRDVMAIPGSPLDQRARGGNALLKQGAALVENAADIAAVLAAAPGRRRPPTRLTLFDDDEEDPRSVREAPAPAPELTAQLTQLLSSTPLHIDELARAAGAPVSLIAAALVELELDGRAASLPGGYAAALSVE